MTAPTNPIFFRLAWGAALWLAFVASMGLRPSGSIFEALFYLAPAVWVGPVLRQLLHGTPSRLGHAILKLEGPSALLCFPALCISPGLISGLLCLPWMGCTLAIALLGLLRLLRQGITAPEEVGINSGLLFIAVGGIWLVIARLGLNPMNFGPLIVFLTAIHFHYAGFATGLILGLSGRILLRHPHPWVRPLYLVSLIGSLAGIPLLALGITFSPLLEVLAALVFATALLIWSGLCLSALRPQLPTRWARGLLWVSALAIPWSMAWALIYALGEWTGATWVSLSQMGLFHGLINVFGFALPALVGLLLRVPPSQLPHTPIPWSQLFGQWRIGADFFERIGAVDQSVEPRPVGLIDDFASYQRPDFDPAQLPHALRHFYEHTGAYTLRVTPEWRWGFVTAGRIFRRIMDRIGQMALPIRAEAYADTVHSQVVPLNSAQDGRHRVRAWIRTYGDTQQVAYAAAYSQHKQADHTYMNIAFPLPGCHMSSVLRLDMCPAEKGSMLRLTSLPVHELFGDQGVYLVFSKLAVRLPINETIQVWDRPQISQWPMAMPPETTVLAQHDMWIFGIHCLRLYYTIYPKT